MYMLMNTHLHCASARETKISFEKQLETYLVGNWENAFGSIGGMQWVSKFAAKSGTNIGGVPNSEYNLWSAHWDHIWDKTWSTSRSFIGNNLLGCIAPRKLEQE